MNSWKFRTLFLQRIRACFDRRHSKTVLNLNFNRSFDFNACLLGHCAWICIPANWNRLSRNSKSRHRLWLLDSIDYKRQRHSPSSKQSLDISWWPCLLGCNLLFVGLMGPMRVFGPLGDYGVLNWFFLGGLWGPVVAVWLLHKKFPTQSWIHTPY